ncbi:hypothetical protein HUX88_10810 [Duganella sp. BJB1802]|uniref:hypothetical protein n=1 Tax=Duganella sp. BJB1802 TaxID=2744575 RepID=UPI001594D0F3|nr:hypothetical protein [Duganella sp. BJB1802]NVD71045.1 hypothetical protein [Duganella sp. BJB1802]
MNRNQLLAALALAASASCHAAVTLQVTTSVHFEPTKSASNLPPDSKTTAFVTLADDYIAAKSGNATTIYDFKNRRRVVLDDANKTYVDYSLYDTLGFRVFEMRNRIGLNAAMAKINPDLKPVRKVDLEQELTLAEDSATVIDAATSGDTLRFTSEGIPLATWSKHGAQAGARDVAHFAQLLRYVQSIHPQVLAKLAEGGVIPDSLTFTTNTSLAPVTVRMDVEKVQGASPPAFTLQGYTPRQATPTQGALEALVDRMAAQTPQQLDALRAAHPCDTEAAYREDQLLDTMLGRIECTLSTGAPMLSFTPAQLEQVRASVPVSLAFSATKVTKQEEVVAAVKTLSGLRSQAPRKAYILKLFEANNRARLREFNESSQLFADVLEANPVLGGAWKDMGDLMIMRFDMPAAWRSWDIGRRIAPTLPNFAYVNQLESEMAKRHPEYLVY